jgi:glycosyltransferase involved in cell wall biosynthesis
MRRLPTRRRGKTRWKDPVVSVILCSYDRSGLVEEAIRSVFRQSYARWELVLVDDGSTDGSELAMAQLARSDDRVVLISRQNRGLARSRNEALKIARGRYVAFLDSDDTLLPSHLKRHVEAMRSDPTLDFLMGTLSFRGPKSARYAPDIHRRGRRIHLSRCQSAGNLFAKRAVLLESGGFPLREFGEDTALITKLKSAYRWKQLKSATYVYNCTAADRMCDIYAKGGTKGLVRFRRGGGV